MSRHGRAVTSVFDLRGRDENDLTAALGFTLARVPEFAARLLAELGTAASTASPVIRMEVADSAGRTDLEIDTGDALYVVEAKRGWLLPSTGQLSAYAPRVEARGAGCLLTLSGASAEWAALSLPAQVAGVPVQHVPWSRVQRMLSQTQGSTRGTARVWLDELHIYLKGALRVKDVADSWTYCLALNRERAGGTCDVTFLEWVTDRGIYFHPYGGSGGWPREAPNFIAFRWDGQVQRIHRVIAAEVVPSLSGRFANIPPTEDTDKPHAVYTLGPALPGVPIPSGRTYRASRLWVLLDQLLTSTTLAEALERTTALTDRTPGNVEGV